MEDGEIAGIVVAAVFLIFAIVIFAIFIIRKWRRRKYTEDLNKDTKLEKIFRTIDKRLTNSKDASVDDNTTFKASKSHPEVRIDITQVREKTMVSDDGQVGGNDNLGCDALESPIRRSANAYSEINLDDPM